MAGEGASLGTIHKGRPHFGPLPSSGHLGLFYSTKFTQLHFPEKFLPKVNNYKYFQCKLGTITLTYGMALFYPLGAIFLLLEQKEIVQNWAI